MIKLSPTHGFYHIWIRKDSISKMYRETDSIQTVVILNTMTDYINHVSETPEEILAMET